MSTTTTKRNETNKINRCRRQRNIGFGFRRIDSLFSTPIASLGSMCIRLDQIDYYYRREKRAMHSFVPNIRCVVTFGNHFIGRKGFLSVFFFYFRCLFSPFFLYCYDVNGTESERDVVQAHIP